MRPRVLRAKILIPAALLAGLVLFCRAHYEVPVLMYHNVGAAQESSGLAACRECLEETGLQVKTVDLLMRRTFTYPHGPVDLHFWLCRPADPEQVAESHRGFRWVPGIELDALKFPEANLPLIQELVQRAKEARGQDR